MRVVGGVRVRGGILIRVFRATHTLVTWFLTTFWDAACARLRFLFGLMASLTSSSGLIAH